MSELLWKQRVSRERLPFRVRESSLTRGLPVFSVGGVVLALQNMQASGLLKPDSREVVGLERSLATMSKTIYDVLEL